MSSEYPYIIFFFGAGASKPADIGTTKEMVSDFGKFLQKEGKSDEKKLCDEIISLLHKEVDIEDLMTAIDRLIDREKDIILKFYKKNELKLKNSDIMPDLKNSLKRFIQITTSVNEDKVSYLKPILVFNKPNNPIKIFSVNYDTLVEQFCNVFKLRYTDGFEYSWHPELFDNEKNFDFHLYKLHGSIMWYQTDRNNYIKLPIDPSTKPVDLIFKEKAVPLILYPMQKWEFVEPLLVMLLKFKNELEKARFLILVGYSFRDQHILRLLHESANNNDGLIIIFVSPHAREIYEEKLQYYAGGEFETGKISSSLENRVLCLQYGFSEVVGKLESITGRCNGAINSQNEYEERKLRGETDPKNLIIQFADIEFLDRANYLKDDINWDLHFTPTTLHIDLMVSCFKLFTVAEIQSKTEWANYWLNKFLYPFLLITKKMPSEIKEVVSNGIIFKNIDSATGTSGAQHHLKQLILFIQEQKKLHKDSLSDLLKDAMGKIQKWFNHVNDIYKNDNILFDNYYKEIHDFCVGSNLKIPESLFKLSEYVKSGKLKTEKKDYDDVKEIVMDIENSIYEQIFGQSKSLHGYVKEKYPSRITK